MTRGSLFRGLLWQAAAEWCGSWLVGAVEKAKLWRREKGLPLRSFVNGERGRDRDLVEVAARPKTNQKPRKDTADLKEAKS
ncbi:hypothetical protein B0H63DRAFT_291069 [Podospora didyma]|uniref:Uncharacterized protein n=1 Tax=Podospora didyma TaxID=330526 RepID=A0AAE0K8V0_9PEZI|nr:hypothetical protein B0H63DRAFT_291069 [Podospora didyma]